MSQSGKTSKAPPDRDPIVKHLHIRDGGLDNSKSQPTKLIIDTKERSKIPTIETNLSQPGQRNKTLRVVDAVVSGSIYLVDSYNEKVRKYEKSGEDRNLISERVRQENGNTYLNAIVYPIADEIGTFHENSLQHIKTVIRGKNNNKTIILSYSSMQNIMTVIYRTFIYEQQRKGE